MNFIFFDRTVCTDRLDTAFYRYCLLRQPSLIKYMLGRWLFGLLNLFGLVHEERYFNRRWRFLKSVRAPLNRAEKFWNRPRPRVYDLFPGEDNLWISRWPEPVLRPLATKHGAVLIAPAFDLVDGRFSHYEDTAALYRRALKSCRPTLAADAPKGLVPTGVETVHVFRGRVFKTEGKCRAAQFFYVLYTFAALLALGIGLGLISMYYGASFYLLEMFISYFSHPLIPLLNILPVVALIFLLYFIFNRVWLAFSLSAIVTLGLSFVNYFKLALRNDPFMAADISLFSEAGSILSRYNVELNRKIWLGVGICILAAVAAVLLARGRVESPRIRFGGLLAVVCLSIFSYLTLYTSDAIYLSSANYQMVSEWSATGNYVCRGFIYPFLYSIKSAKVEPPEGYDELEAIKELSYYVTEDIPDEDKVNVVFVMLEAFADLSELNCLDFTEDIYRPLHLLEKDSVSGSLVTDIFAGNTVQTEWAVLTGNTVNDNYRSDVSSYARYFRNQGYHTEGSHPCYDWFYNRVNVNEYLGFDDYYFCENRYNDLYGGVTYDDDLFKDIRTLFEQHVESSDQPYFNFSVTYQNHGPYESKTNYFGRSFIAPGSLTTDEQNIINNYLGGVANTIENVVALADYFDKRDEPVILVVFGDHMPWMGNSNSVYAAMGANLNFDKEGGFLNYYSTPYLIHANPSAEYVLNVDFTGEGETISPCFLMNELFSWAGWGGTAYMKVAGELMSMSPVVHVTGRYMIDGELTSQLPQEVARKLSIFNNIQYYRRWNFADYR